MHCRVLNEGDVPFEFTAALHSYFEVASVDVAKVTGLTGLTYLDKSVDPNSPSVRVEGRKAVAFGAALVDSVYQSAPDTVALDVGTGAYQLSFIQQHLHGVIRCSLSNNTYTLDTLFFL